ncbi:hypothetical protein HO173_000184 [Letharia columbiana]|uniref:Protein kinase domain-containing protein n=1 Tax=Letharia columbiana TaxID=112416 RepID=A0A8H6G6Q9_9LECA|nr:uncharacterized protein HO173_000184 [Letharia columbiana]KAF6241474.1 hypothetical protein HO173_000184 [Letharia columbiana]
MLTVFYLALAKHRRGRGKKEGHTDCHEFYKNEPPKEITIISNDSPQPPSWKGNERPQQQQPQATVRGSQHANKKRTSQTAAHDTARDQQAFFHTRTYSNENIESNTILMDRTTSLQTTAPTSLGPHSIHGTSGAHDGNSAVGQKRKRVTQQPIRDEMEKRKKIKKKLKEEKIKVVGDAHSSSIPPPKPHVKAGDINVRSIKDTATVNGETDDAEGYYRVTEENRRIGDRYCIGRPLGMGTSGEVHEAFDKQTKSKCAIKITRVQDEARDELRVLQTLYLNDEQNQNKCIHLRDCFEFCNHICIVTDVLGKSLSDFLKDNESMTFPSSHIQSFARQLFVSVAYMSPLLPWLRSN